MSILFCNATHRWFWITSSDRGSTSPIMPLKNSSPESIWRMNINSHFPGCQYTLTLDGSLKFQILRRSSWMRAMQSINRCPWKKTLSSRSRQYPAISLSVVINYWIIGIELTLEAFANKSNVASFQCIFILEKKTHLIENSTFWRASNCWAVAQRTCIVEPFASSRLSCVTFINPMSISSAVAIILKEKKIWL